VSIDIILLSSGRKLIKVNEVTRRRLNEVIGQVNVVMFGPQDLTIVSGDPSQRRHFLNLAIAQTSREYYYNLAQYRKVLRQRNSLLKSLEGQLNRAELLDPWDEQLLHYGARLMEIRCRVVAQLAEKAQQTHYHLANGQEELTVRYGPSFDLQGATTAEELAQVFQAELQRRREEEIRRGVTLIGPHRDDLLLEVNGLEARLYASQGQQRTAAIALKLAELSLIREWIGESPLLLLDDVMSELDDRRRRQVMALTDDVEQIFITCSQKSTFSQAILRRAGLFQVHAGTITPVPLG
ncbi:MAG TPA: DNA replication/repair protein RecF, partial [Armatimonadetes bacterium]|nr:DNA replication/repair protein RecF [Armatimonadota bacterium]